ncbi:MAG: DUF445 domain-containing protein [Alphaproteobacteria bacterium]
MGSDVPPSTMETGGRRQSPRSRRVATGLLALMVVVSLATHLAPEPDFWTLLVRAGAEAALVGGLADWFAVTALFRHPFGIPIPHTALIPRNKDRIGASLGSFVERHFLEPGEIRRKLRDIDVVGRLSAWLTDGDRADALAGQLATLLAQALESFDDRTMRDAVHRAVLEPLHTIDLASILARALEMLTESGQHRALFDHALRIAARFLVLNEETIHRKVAEHSVWWLPASVDAQVARTVIATVRDLLTDFADPGNPVRDRLDAQMHQVIETLRTSPVHRRRIESLRDTLLASPAMRDTLTVLWDEVKRMIVEDARAPSSRLREVLAGGVRAVGQALVDDDAMRRRLNRRVEAFVVVAVVAPLRSEIGTFIAEVVRRWDAQTVTGRMEREVGNDLQYIRINGTVVGALVGCLLYLGSVALTH